MPFRALMLNQVEGQTHAGFTELPETDLTEGDVLVKVAYSSLNYKDALAVTGAGKVIRRFPIVPGIDLAGAVVESASPGFQPGDPVILTSCEAGETSWGGYAQMARVRAEWLIPLPQALTLEQAMGIGTAGFTAMMAVMALEAHGCRPGSGEVVVTGACGGVGSLAIAILAARGYAVTASTGRPHLHEYLSALGAGAIIDRDALAPPPKPLQKEQWAGAVDNVGGEALAAILSTMARGGSVALCGLAGGHELHTTVYPFILRGVNLLGINSATAPRAQRLEVWARLVRDLPLALLDRVVQVAPLSDILDLSRQMLAGRVRGRVVIDVNA